MTFLESSSRSSFLFEHDLFRKPLHTFRDHALIDGLTAVDHDRGAVHVGGGIGDKKSRDVADLVALREALQHDLLQRRLGIGLAAVEISFHPWRQRGSWTQRVHPQSLLAVVDRELARERHDAALGRAIDRHVRIADMREGRRHIEDRRVLRLQQQRNEGAAHVEDAVEIDRDQLVPFLGRELGDGRDEIVAGIVDDRFGASPFLLDEVAQARDVLLLRHAGGEGFGPGAALLERRLHLVELGLRAADQHRGRAELGQRFGGGAPDTAGRSSDDHDFAIEPQLLEHRFSPRLVPLRRRYSAAWVCKPAYSLSVSVCRAGSTSRANSLMFFSVRSRGSVANCSSARRFWKPSSRWASMSCLRTVSGLPHRMMPCSIRVSTVCSCPETDRLWLSMFFSDLALR